MKKKRKVGTPKEIAKKERPNTPIEEELQNLHATLSNATLTELDKLVTNTPDSEVITIRHHIGRPGDDRTKTYERQITIEKATGATQHHVREKGETEWRLENMTQRKTG